MTEIKYLKGSLFDAPPGSVLVHACNTQGVWGGGIAAEFRVRFPRAYGLYKAACQKSSTWPGSAFVFEDRQHYVGCLLTSEGFGQTVDAPQKILQNTRIALDMLQNRIAELGYPSVYSNRFNSGLFRVPWADTASVLQETWTGGLWTVFSPL